MSNWLKYQHEDTLARDMANFPNRTFNINIAAEYSGTDIYNHHCKPYGMEHVLGTVFLDKDTQLFNYLLFYRADQARPYTEDERELKEELAQHLIEAVRTNWLTNLPHLFSPKQRSSFNAIAACNENGSLMAAMPSFVDACRREWPNWKGPFLPEDLISALRGKNSKYVGANMTVSMRPLGNLTILRIRDKIPADNLTPRELEVAQQFSNGLDYKTIAQALLLSPSTIRTHLNNIYLKLSIDNKASLVSELVRLEN